MPKGSERKYSTIRLPTALVEEVGKLVEELGYRSRADFVKEAVKAKLKKYR